MASTGRFVAVQVARMRVDGGFLAGLDVSFRSGLNVVIGPRGVGKTTLLELLRFAIGARHADKSRERQQHSFVEAILGSGTIVVDLESVDDAVRLQVEASGAGRRIDLEDSVLVLGQNELERIASDGSSRLNLIDLRAKVRSGEQDTEALRALTVEMTQLRRQMERMQEQLSQRNGLVADLENAQQREAALMAQATSELAAKRKELERIETQARDNARRKAAALSFSESLSLTVNDFGAVADRLESLDAPVLNGEAGEISALLEMARGTARELQGTLAGLSSETTVAERTLRDHEASLRIAAHPIRVELDEAESGLGEVTAEVRNLRGQIDQLDHVETERDRLRARYEELRADREHLLQQQEVRQESIHELRKNAARQVSVQAGTKVSVTVEHLADNSKFREVLAESLRGSPGLQHNVVANLLAPAILPTELLKLIEEGDLRSLADTYNLGDSRASKVAAALDDPLHLGSIATVLLEDAVDFQLREGSATRSVEQLSTGQKCAVTLPILLTEHSRTLILDQPEDNLDNAYLVDNIVAALNGRAENSAQTIVATHNANIPVLGSANQVLSLSSDGRRGFVSSTGAFDAPEIVDEITSLMEGGRAAFERRAEFYRSHGSSRG